MLYLIRHPEPEIAPGICYGQRDIPVHQQALADAITDLTERFRGHPTLCGGMPPILVTSPLQRCTQLADALSTTLGWPLARREPRLMEFNFGDWEECPWDSIPRPLLDAWATDTENFQVPQGESVRTFQQRILDWLGSISNCCHEQSHVVVTHAGVIRVLRGWFENTPPAVWMHYPVDFASLTILDTTGKMPTHVCKQP